MWNIKRKGYYICKAFVDARGEIYIIRQYLTVDNKKVSVLCRILFDGVILDKLTLYLQNSTRLGCHGGVPRRPSIKKRDKAKKLMSSDLRYDFRVYPSCYFQWDLQRRWGEAQRMRWGERGWWGEWGWVGMSGDEWGWVGMSGDEWGWVGMSGDEWGWVGMSGDEWGWEHTFPLAT